MRSQDGIHVNEEQLFWAVVDDKELTGEDRRHIRECALCNGKIEQLREELQKFGENARLSVPAMTKAVTLPKEETASAGGRFGMLPSFAAAAMAGLVLFVYFLGIESTNIRIPDFQSPEDILAEEYLMDEIFEMVENPLPDDLYELTGDNGEFDDDFLDYVVPEVQEDFQSQYYVQGGVTQC